MRLMSFHLPVLCVTQLPTYVDGLLTLSLVSKFDAEVGLQYLRGMHLNDSKTELGSKKDRHENIGL
jgi:hypothetical protein